MAKKAPALVMLGPDPEARGGIASVQRIWLQAGLLDERPVRVLTTYRDGSALRKLGAFVTALLRFLLLLAAGRVAAVHVHSASNATNRYSYRRRLRRHDPVERRSFGSASRRSESRNIEP